MVRAGSRVRVRFENGTKYRGTVKRVRREDGNPVALTIDYDDGTCETADFPDHDVEVMEDGVDESSEEEADDGHDSRRRKRTTRMRTRTKTMKWTTTRARARRAAAAAGASTSTGAPRSRTMRTTRTRRRRRTTRLRSRADRGGGRARAPDRRCSRGAAGRARVARAVREHDDRVLAGSPSTSAARAAARAAAPRSATSSSGAALARARLVGTAAALRAKLGRLADAALRRFEQPPDDFDGALFDSACARIERVLDARDAASDDDDDDDDDDAQMADADGGDDDEGYERGTRQWAGCGGPLDVERDLPAAELREARAAHEARARGATRARPRRRAAAAPRGKATRAQIDARRGRRDGSPRGDGARAARLPEEGVAWPLYNWHQRRLADPADEMGLGKTAQTICFLLGARATYGAAPRGPALVVAPLGRSRTGRASSALGARARRGRVPRLGRGPRGRARDGSLAGRERRLARRRDARARARRRAHDVRDLPRAR